MSSDFNRASSIVSENQLLLKTVLNSRLEDKEKVVEQKENLNSLKEILNHDGRNQNINNN